MSANLPPVSAVVPAQNNGIELTTSRDVLKLIFSHFSPKDLLRCGAVNKEWRSVANDFLNQLEDPRGIKHPIYTRAELIEKLRDCLTRTQPNQELLFNVALFRSRNSPCPTIKTTFSFNPSRFSLLPRKQPIIIEAILDEVTRASADSVSISSNNSDSTLMDGRKYTSRIKTLSISAPEDLAQEIRTVTSERMNQLTTSFREAGPRKFNITATATMILVALAALYIFMNTTGQSTKDL